MQRLISTLLVLLVSTWAAAGCAIRGDGKNVAYVIDGTAIVAGVAILSSKSEPSEDRGLDATVTSIGNGFLSVVGTSFLVAGGIGLVMNMSINSGVDNEKEKESDEIAEAMVFRAHAPGAIEPKPIGPCTHIIAAWSAEKNHKTRYERFKDMPSACRREIVDSD